MSDKETAPRVDNRPCDDCGNENPVWFADNEVWNAAVPERVGYICPNCFIRRADSKIRTTGWKLVPEVAAECRAPAPQPTRFAEFDDDEHPFRQWWVKHGQFMLSGGGRRESIWAARGWIAREQLACGAEVTGDSMHERGTSGQASPTPDKCPRCGSHSKNGYYAHHDDQTKRCYVKGMGRSDPWHSSAGTPKGTK